MKNYIILSIIILLGVTSCTDLDVVPKNGQALEPVVFSQKEAYGSYLAKIYASYILTGQEGPAGAGDISIIADEGFSCYIRAYWKAQELTTDEAVIRWTDAGIQDLNTNSWSSDNQFVRVLYYRLYFTISIANDFLRVSDTYTSGFDEAFLADLEVQKAEARYLRALSYWHALDLYRNVTLITQVGSALPVQVTPTALYNFILDELNAIEPILPEPSASEYGRANKAAVWMLRGKLKLNAPVYLPSGASELNGIYNDVITDMNAIINAGYSLAPNYHNNFQADNQTSPEIIFALTSDGNYSQSYGGTTFLVNGMLFPKEDTTDIGHMKPRLWGMSGGWLGVRCTSNFVELFESSPGVFNGDTRQVFFTPGRTKSVDILFEAGSEDSGYPSPKYTNLASDGSPGSNPSFPDTDYPMFRLGDVYLMYAEAVLRGGSGDMTTAIGYVNDLITRAYGDASANVTSIDLDFVLEERARELYFEAYRRQDLIRFNKFSDRAGADEMFWQWKGNDINGKTISSHLEIFPIPASDLAANRNLFQNTGY